MIADSKTQMSGERTLEARDVRVGAGIGLKLFKASGEFLGERFVGVRVEPLRLGQQADAIHPDALFAKGPTSS